MVIRRLAILGLGWAAAVSAQPATTKLEAVSGIPMIDKTTQSQDVRFKTDVADRMTVPVKVSGSGPYRFLVDTGADRTAISRELAGRLKLEVGDRASLHSVAGVSSVSTAMVPDPTTPTRCTGRAAPVSGCSAGVWASASTFGESGPS